MDQDISIRDSLIQLLTQRPGEGSNGSDRYLSEDYMFCQFVRKLGIKTWFCPWMKLGHTGSYVFNGTMGALANLDYAAHGMDTKSRPHLVTQEEEQGEQVCRTRVW